MKAVIFGDRAGRRQDQVRLPGVQGDDGHDRAEALGLDALGAERDHGVPGLDGLALGGVDGESRARQAHGVQAQVALEVDDVEACQVPEALGVLGDLPGDGVG